MNRYLKLLALLLLPLFTLPSCQKSPKYRIGVSQCSSDAWRSKMNDEILREVMFHDNVEVEIRSAEDNSTRQIDDLRYFASNDFDVIIAAPNEAHALTPIVDSIYAAGIPIILFDRDIENDNYTAFQGADNRRIGVDAAKYILSKCPDARVIEIYGLTDCTPAIDRHEGFAQVVDADPNLHLLGSGVGYWREPEGRRVADSLLRLYPDANAIYAHNDRMAMGARLAADSLGLHDILIIGVDAAPNIGMQATADGVIDATFIYPTEGGKLIDTALAIIEGKPYERKLIIPSLSAVDAKNAEILLAQNQLLTTETEKVNELNRRLDTYWEKHASQTYILYGTILFLVLCAVTLFVVLRSFWIQRRAKQQIEDQNRRLKAQKDEIEMQNQQLTAQKTEIEQQNQRILAQKDEIDNALTMLRQATQSKLTFFTNVSHDLRTPLTLIAEPVKALSVASNLTPQQSTLAHLASKNVKILMRLINQILDFRKYENGKLEMSLTEVNIASQISEWTEAFRQTAIRRHQHFAVNIPSDIRAFSIAVDIDKMERVIYNLLSNAIKYTPENGDISVSLSKDENNVYLQVKNSGKGINADEISRIFERFYRADQVHPKGSGIGLALTKAFIELHGGSITAQSIPGEYTSFDVSIPIRHVAPSEDVAIGKTDAAPIEELSEVEESLSSPDESQKSVLVIDDNADICTLIKTVLGDSYTILRAADGALGIKIATKYVPDLIICDMMMPGIDGNETCRRLKEEVTTSHIPVLMLTACALDEQRIEGYNSGADGYLTKPFSFDVLRARCDALIANRLRLKNLSADSTLTPVTTQKNTPSDKASDIENEFYKRFVDIVEEHIENPDISIEEIADIMGMSRVQLYRKIKALTNYSPVELIRNLRLQRAPQMLKTTEKTVSEICYSVGFTSPSYFTKCFREYFGETPGEVQKRTSKI